MLGSFVIVATALDPTVMVTFTGVIGVVEKAAVLLTWRFLPTVTSEQLISPVFTFAVICVFALGVLNPAGVPTESVVVPTPTGWNAVPAVFVFAAIMTGLVVIVPTAVFELVTGTFTLAIPPRRFCTAMKPPIEVSMQGLTCNCVSAAYTGVMIPEALLNLKPEGFTVIVFVTESHPAALMVRVVVPIDLPCT